MKLVKTYDQSSDLDELFVGRRIVRAEPDVPKPEVKNADLTRYWFTGTPPYGRLTLDDGTVVYVVGNDGGCACSAGCYQLTRLGSVDNIITAVKVVDESRSDDDAWKDGGDNVGRFQIFVVTGAEELNVAEFEGSDGNGYYGTGFHLAVVGVE